MSAERKKRVLLIASGGGHWVQLRRLAPAFAEFEVAYVSVFEDYADDVPGCRFYAVEDVTRLSLPKLVKLIPQYVRILVREKPDVIVTTGSAPGMVGLAVARATTRAKTVWIDSIANCERLSSSGKLARFFAHEWLTQWPALATPGGPRYWGAVL